MRKSRSVPNKWEVQEEQETSRWTRLPVTGKDCLKVIQQESLLLPKAVLMSNTALALFPTQTSWVWSTMYSQGQLQTPQVWYQSKHQHHSFLHLELPFLLCRCNFFNSETQWKAQLPFLLLHFYQRRKKLSYMAFGISTESTERKRVMGGLLGF